jgi:hypothetical protein
MGHIMAGLLQVLTLPSLSAPPMTARYQRSLGRSCQWAGSSAPAQVQAVNSSEGPFHAKGDANVESWRAWAFICIAQRYTCSPEPPC